MTYSALVVIHDAGEHLRALLDSLAAHPVPELIVVDAQSTDDGPQRARAAGAKVVDLGANPGFGPANNVGLEHVTNDVTVLVNPDCVVLDDALDRLAAHATHRDALHVPRLLNDDRTIQRSAHPLPASPAAALSAVVHPPALPRALREAAEPWRADQPREVGWAIGAVLAARTDTLRALGPFDPKAFLYYDDLDLCLRARTHGIPTVLWPELSVVHSGGHATRDRWGDAHAHVWEARRRRQVVGANLGSRRLAIDDALQAVTFATRFAARPLLGRSAGRPRAQLSALVAARRQQPALGRVSRSV